MLYGTINAEVKTFFDGCAGWATSVKWTGLHVGLWVVGGIDPNWQLADLKFTFDAQLCLFWCVSATRTKTVTTGPLAVAAAAAALLLKVPLARKRTRRKTALIRMQRQRRRRTTSSLHRRWRHGALKHLDWVCVVQWWSQIGTEKPIISFTGNYKSEKVRFQHHIVWEVLIWF